MIMHGNRRERADQYSEALSRHTILIIRLKSLPLMEGLPALDLSRQ